LALFLVLSAYYSPLPAPFFLRKEFCGELRFSRLKSMALGKKQTGSIEQSLQGKLTWLEVWPAFDIFLHPSIPLTKTKPPNKTVRIPPFRNSRLLPVFCKS
jgi:hypothetical protein